MDQNNLQQPPMAGPEQTQMSPQQPPMSPQMPQQPHFMPQMKPQMGFVEAVKTCLLEKYCCFTGRARRSEFWWWQLAVFCLNAVLSVFAAVSVFGRLNEISSNPLALYTSPGYIVIMLVALALLLPNLGVQVRRLHDIGKSGHWLWICLLAIIPIVGTLAVLVFGIVLIVWYCQDSDPQPNRYGPSPKYS